MIHCLSNNKLSSDSIQQWETIRIAGFAVMPRVPTMLILKPIVATGIKPFLAIVLNDQDKLRSGVPEMDYLAQWIRPANAVYCI